MISRRGAGHTAIAAPETIRIGDGPNDQRTRAAVRDAYSCPNLRFSLSLSLSLPLSLSLSLPPPSLLSLAAHALLLGSTLLSRAIVQVLRHVLAVL